MWTHTFGHICLFWRNFMFISGMKGRERRKWTVQYVTHCCVHLRASFPLHHSTLSLNSLSSCSANTLLPEPAIPSPQTSHPWKIGLVTKKRKKKTNLGLWNLSQRREETLCNPLSSLCVWSCPKCFLQNRRNRDSGFLWWSLCFWAVMKRGKAQTHHLGNNVMKPISWFRELCQLLYLSCSVSSSFLKSKKTSHPLGKWKDQVYSVKKTPLKQWLVTVPYPNGIPAYHDQIMDIFLLFTNNISVPCVLSFLLSNPYIYEQLHQQALKPQGDMKTLTKIWIVR